MTSDSTILVVDDDETQHYLTGRCLKRLAFDGDVADAFDGTDAIRWLADNGRPLLVFLDLRMRLMDGHEVLENIAAGNFGPPPLVCISSSSSRPEDLELPDRYDFVIDYVEKPPTPDAVRALAARHPEIGRYLAAEPV